MTNLALACKELGWQGGTIHQVAKELEIDAMELLVMPQDKLKEILESKEIDTEDEEHYVIYWDCNNCGNSYREGEAEDLKQRCTCGKTLVENKVYD